MTTNDDLAVKISPIFELYLESFPTRLVEVSPQLQLYAKSVEFRQLFVMY